MSSYDTAVGAAQILKGYLEKHGVRVSVELQNGARAKYGWYNPLHFAELSHHTATRRSMGSTPALYVVKRGRSDVPGPLANGYMGFDLVYRIITMGVANHSGKGGPLSFGGRVIPRDLGAYYMWGTEYEGGLDINDFTPSYRHAMGAANAGICEYLAARNAFLLDSPYVLHAEHSTWAPFRKIDRLEYDRAKGIDEIKTSVGTDIRVPEPLAVTPELINARLRLMDIQPAGRDQDYDRKAVYTYQNRQRYPVAPRLVPDSWWGQKTEDHFNWVYSLQVALNKIGGKTNVDGDYYAHTKFTVKNAQSALGLVEDGEAGPITCAALHIEPHPQDRK